MAKRDQPAMRPVMDGRGLGFAVQAMAKREMPAMRPVINRGSLGSAPPVRAFERWNPAVRAAAGDEGDAVITILGAIGEDWWTDTDNSARRIGAELRRIGARDVTVHVNSPGGDFFEGLAIYNLLREHPQDVTVKVLGLAASAASIITMAGDTVMVPRAGFIMIHNVSAIAIGNRHDFREMADMLEPFDATLADIYSARTGLPKDDITRMLDREAWIGGAEAVEKGFADQLLPSDAMIEEDDPAADPAPAAHRLDSILARQGMPRAERRRLIKDIKGGTPSAADQGTPGAADTPSGLRDALDTLTSIRL
ncbi:head maturation protease, ClpP-related [Inquilinus sp. CA228]|uniref:head maturation protease, ClpP-related n=1 Tax=Inquilinus sp. CA228 TaxID=3455609 RepID=UPI003F8D7B45